MSTEKIPSLTITRYVEVPSQLSEHEMMEKLWAQVQHHAFHANESGAWNVPVSVEALGDRYKVRYLNNENITDGSIEIFASYLTKEDVKLATSSPNETLSFEIKRHDLRLKISKYLSQWVKLAVETHKRESVLDKTKQTVSYRHVLVIPKGSKAKRWQNEKYIDKLKRTERIDYIVKYEALPIEIKDMIDEPTKANVVHLSGVTIAADGIGYVDIYKRVDTLNEFTSGNYR